MATASAKASQYLTTTTPTAGLSGASDGQRKILTLVCDSARLIGSFHQPALAGGTPPVAGQNCGAFGSLTNTMPPGGTTTPPPYCVNFRYRLSCSIYGRMKVS